MQIEEKFSIENNLEASFNFYLYKNSSKNHLQMWNYSAYNFENEKIKEIVYYCNNNEYLSLDEMIKTELNDLCEYLKIELIDVDNELLNNYKKTHPELSEILN